MIIYDDTLAKSESKVSNKNTTPVFFMMSLMFATFILTS